MTQKTLLLAVASTLAMSAAQADDLKFLCYQDGNECEVLTDLATKFNGMSGHNVMVETVGYDIIRDQLENQLQTDAGA